mmetsp:Transcript_68745/g.139330  ORF Transcript_68745/g.139330 Transcript_68745/m.139330 type:complete len:212 (+) Transcript_68745:100-735(+)
MFDKIAVLVGCPCSADNSAPMNLGQDDLVEASCDLDHVLIQPAVKTEDPEDKQEEKAPKESEKSEKSGPNFSGDWVLLRVEGDFDAFMKAKGIGYVSRSLAKSTGYGVNKMHQSVEQDGDKLKITTTNPKGTKVLNLLANVEEQDGTDPIDDKPIKIRAAWDGSALVMTLRSQRPAKELGSVKRYLQEEDTIQELVAPDGVVVRRVFSRAK